MDIAAQLTPYAANETATLRTVVLGLPDSPGATPSLEEAYDATSYRSVELGIYPQEKDIKRDYSPFWRGIKGRGFAQRLSPTTTKYLRETLPLP